MSILVTKQDGIATITLNRPDKLNALSEEMYHGIAEHSVALDADDEVRTIVLTGAGRAFCAGGDVGSMGGYDVVTGRKRSQQHKRAVINPHNIEKPVIAAVRGSAAGIGFSLALACDLIMLLEMENLAVCGARLTEDHKEGIAAFKERRPAKFTGR